MTRVSRVTRPTVSTTAGVLAGEQLESGVFTFKGIPYAAPPVGTRRFRAPEPVAPWTGERDAVAYGATCPQPRNNDGQPESEDCLFLNVWTPSTTDGARRPVMVWFHGGGYAFGSGSSPLFDGTALASQGDVVVITVNHRLGPLGYLHLGDVSDDPTLAASGNAGVLDLVAALEWVQREVAAFGGDPGNVTIFGESGGGAKVCALLTMPAAAGLFHRGIVQSGALLRVRSTDGGTRTSKVVLDELGIDRTCLDRLWDVTAEELVTASLKLGRHVDGRALVPVLDGTVIPRHPEDALADGSAHDIPIIVGANRDEGAGALPAELDEAGLRAKIAKNYGEEHAVRIEDAYRAVHPAASPLDLWSFVISDAGMRHAAIRLAELKSGASTTPVYEYFFTYELGGRAGHGYEIQFVFNNLGGGARSEARRQLAAEMSGAWLAFARTGDPNHGGVSAWPPYRAPGRATMIFGRDGSHAVEDPAGATRELWTDLVRD